MRRSILLIHPGSLGDVLLSVPAIRKIRAAFPDHDCGLIAGAQVGCLLVACREVDRLFPLEQDGLAGLMAGSHAVSPSLRLWLARADLTIGWLQDPDGHLAATLSALGVRTVIIRSPFSSCASLHQADRYLETVASVVNEKKINDRPLQLPEVIRQEAAACLAKTGVRKGQMLVALHPGSGSPHKCIGPGVLGQVIEWLQGRGATPLLFGGPADAEQVSAVRQACARPPVVFEGMDLGVLVGFLAHASLYVGHDSGLTHLVSWLGVPTIALFGPTDPAQWAPQGSHVEVVRGAPCVCKGWAAVQACTEKPCLQVPAEHVINVCRRRMRDQAQGLSAASFDAALPCHG